MGFERTSMVPSPAGSLGKRVGDTRQAGTAMDGTGLTIAARSKHGDVPYGVSASLVAHGNSRSWQKWLRLPASS
jgi:hypothetical protein